MLPLKELIDRAAYRSKTEVEQLVVTLRPGTAPRDGVRLVAGGADSRAREAAPPESAASADAHCQGLLLNVVSRRGETFAGMCAPATDGTSNGSAEVANATAADPALPRAAASAEGTLVTTAAAPPSRSPAEMKPVAAEQWSLRVTMDSAMKADLELLQSLLSHGSGRDLASVIREALRCGVEKHGKRRGAVSPTRTRRSGTQRNTRCAAATSSPADERGIAAAARENATVVEAPSLPGVATIANVGTALESATDCRESFPAGGHDIPLHVRREVWSRDGGCCSWTSADGVRCRSRHQLQFDHIQPAGLGGPSTAKNLRLVCRVHNMLEAERVYGRDHMDRFRKRPARSQREASRSVESLPLLRAAE